MTIPKNQLKTFARKLRENQTETEQLLWSHLRNRQLGFCKFRRQYPVGSYIVDFACLDPRIIIEVDGGQHFSAKEYDEKRTKFLEEKGYRVMRFWDHEVLRETESVLQRIFDVLVEEKK